MNKSKEFDLDNYIFTICEEVGIDPNTNAFAGTELSKKGIFINFENLIRFVIYQNWDPGFKLKGIEYINDTNNFKIKDTGKFNSLLKNFRLKDGLVPKDYLFEYLKFAQKYLTKGLFITNVFEAVDIYINLEIITNSELPVLLFGETGTEKSLIARIIHETSSRRTKQFCFVNCGGLSDDDLYSQIFGYVKGSRSEATNDFKGNLLIANKGTLYIDEINDLGPKCQIALLKYLDEGWFCRFGDTKKLHSNCRIIFATTKFTRQEMKSFREDLYFAITRHTFIRFPLRHFRNNIPLIIALHTQIKEIPEILFPDELLIFWEKIHAWPNNYKQFYSELDRYIIAYTSSINSKSSTKSGLMFAPPNLNLESVNPFSHNNTEDIPEETHLLNNLLGLLNLQHFVEYISTKEYIHANIYDISTMGSFLFLSFVLQFINDNAKDDYDLSLYPEYSIINCHRAYRELTERYGLKKGTPISKINEIFKNKRSSISQKTIDSIETFNIPDELPWQKLRVGWSKKGCMIELYDAEYDFHSDERNYTQMGFESLRPKGRPIKEWELVLGKLARNGGQIYFTEDDRFLPQGISKVNERLALFFDNNERLIELNEDDKKNPFYFSKFQIYETH